ncbi:MAG TPA: hypothetical protein VH307_16005 [Streptosporangiaceae bacterium]|nr:hypothetical protein [Streptosporangiaceae bacterium]
MPRQHSGEELGEVDAVPAEVAGLDLGAAGKPVREDRGARVGAPDRWPQPVFRAGGRARAPPGLGQRLLEEIWNLPALTARDAAANTPLDALDFTSHPAFLRPPSLPEPSLEWGTW